MFGKLVSRRPIEDYHLTMRMASILVVETSVTNNSPSQDPNHPHYLFQSRYVTPGFKPFSYNMKKKLTGTLIETTYRKRFSYLYVSIINHVSTGVRPNYNNVTTFVYGP